MCAPRIENYWCTSHPLFTPQLPEVVPLVLHLVDSTAQNPHGQAEYDPLFKVCKPKLESEYNSHEHMSVEGRLGFKQYLKDKPTKWGIKVFVLSDATKGMCVDSRSIQARMVS